uniref:Pentapeptide repeat protein n=2 Tax=Siphoviridae sp. ctMgg26 TaxID=2825462 RepID=A0A8S5PYY4_9CAUD|nr:MAG TPA: pentapeptide repeat protein [Siphoviridae sp. ctMgg26]
MMNQTELNKILENHLHWIKEDCENWEDMRADLSGADLRWADLSGDDLSGADLRGADLRWADLRWADLSGADLSGANLSGANLRGADLSEADLSGADLDFSCLPLWCGSLKTNFDDRQLIQIAFHLVSAGLYSKNASEETKAELSKLIDFANRFHRVDECGRIGKGEGE